MIPSIVLEEDDVFVKADIKDYFMSGEPSVLVENANSMFTGAKKSLMIDISNLLVENQFVQSDCFPGRLWYVVKGTGMGLSHSGEFADAAFYTVAERAWAVNRTVQETYGCKLYLRFKDDIFMIFRNNFPLIRRWISEFRHRSRCWTITVDTFSRSGVNFLDVELHKARSEAGTFYINIGPYTKHTSLGVPLSTRSAHHPKIHVEWPINNLIRLHSLSSSSTIFASAKDLFIQRFRDNFEHPALTQYLHEFYTGPKPVGCMESFPRVFKSKSDRRDSWLVLPYHPIWKDARMSSVIRDFFSPGLWHSIFCTAFGFDPKISCRISWRNALQGASGIFTSSSLVTAKP